VEIPAEAALAVHTRSKQLKDKAEQQQLKRLVLEYEQKQEDESRQGKEVEGAPEQSKSVKLTIRLLPIALHDSMARRGIRLKFEPSKS
jgi:hypothetical protein